MVRRSIISPKATITVVMGVILLLALACSSGGGSTAAVTVKMSEFKYEPAQLTATAGQPFKLTLQNGGTVVHDMSAKDLPEFPEHSLQHVPPGQNATVEFTPAKAGTYDIVCSEPGHEVAGMKGTLTVK